MDIEVIEPNEYVRTEKGHISQNLTTIPWIAKDTTIDGDLVAKHDKNIVDLIEIKDIVELQNLKGDIFNFEFEIFNDKAMIDFKLAIDSNEVKLVSILTHEQYERNCYRLEE